MNFVIQKYLSPVFDQRIRFLVLHYTEANLEKSLELLTKRHVSCHYLVPDTFINNEPTVYNLVDESLRAYHAGESYWQGRTNLNDSSIGIEIVNLGFKDIGLKREWYSFEQSQINIVIALCKDIMSRFQIQPINVLAHSDIAPDRKIDPGPLFPWQQLAHHNIGAWPNIDDVENFKSKFKNESLDIKLFQTHLKKFGYNINITGELNQQTKNVLQAFQMHYRSKNYCGEPDLETFAILSSLIKKYFP